MPILVSCRCGKRFRVKEEHAGKTAKCPFCGATLVISIGTQRNTTCDHCNRPIENGSGYCFFSSASIGLPGTQQLTGNMMLCSDCTNKTINPDNWRRRIPERRELTGADILADPKALLDNIRAANEDSIVQNCRTHGFTPEQAKAKARELAQRWWRDPETAQRENARFWTSGSALSSQTTGLPTLHAQGTCWYCSQQPATDFVEFPMHRVSGEHSEAFGSVVRVTYECVQRSFHVGRCAKCKLLHERMKHLIHLAKVSFVVSLLPFVAFMIYSFASHGGNEPIVGMEVYVLLGTLTMPFIVGGFFFLRGGLIPWQHGIREVDNVSKHPDRQALVAAGWRDGLGPPGAKPLF